MTQRVPGRTFAAAVGAALVLAACTLRPLPTPTIRPSPSPTPSPIVTVPPPPPSPTPTPVPTPDRGAIPNIASGELAVTQIDGMRVRQRPGTDAPTVTGLLPLGAELEVVMGPFIAGDLGWYLVTDVDPDEPDFDEGWIAAGFEPEPFLRGSDTRVEDSPWLHGMAGFGDAEEGPVDIGRGDHLVRWIATDPERSGCRFGVSLAETGGEPVRAISATVGSGVDRGTLQPQQFAAVGVRGSAFVTVTSDCDWALVIGRAMNPDASASPSARP